MHGSAWPVAIRVDIGLHRPPRCLLDAQQPRQLFQLAVQISQQLFQHGHLWRQFAFFLLLRPCGDQTLHRAARQVGHTPRTLLLAQAGELVKLVLRNAEINETFSRFQNGHSLPCSSVSVRASMPGFHEQATALSVPFPWVAFDSMHGAYRFANSAAYESSL